MAENKHIETEMAHNDNSSNEVVETNEKSVAIADVEPTAPSAEVTVKRQSLSDIFTIFCAGFALISDGYQNNLM